MLDVRAAAGEALVPMRGCLLSPQRFGLVGAALLQVWMGLAGESAPKLRPLARAHAHNDYEHTRPLLDALEQGFCSVEADIHLVDGKLLVAHDLAEVRPERTIEALYFEPLRARTEANGGWVYPKGTPFWLLIDFKSDGQATWQVLEPLLEAYRGMLTSFAADRTETNAVTVVLSGNAPRSLLGNEAIRLAALDGRPPDLAANPSQHLVPLVSESWGRLFRWRGEGPMAEEERLRLREMVAQAHAQGRRIRFWGAPDIEARWQIEFDAGVDLINTDRLEALTDFLRTR